MYTPKYSLKSLLPRCLIILAGIAIAAFGTALFIYSNLGGDPFTAFMQGLSNVTGFSVGNSINIFNAVCFVIVLFINRKMIHIGMLFYVCFMGVFCDVFIDLLGGVLPDVIPMYLRIPFVIGGVVLVGFGLGLYQASELGAGPADSIIQTVATKSGRNLRSIRIAYDVILVIGAFFMGGTIFVGTVLGMLFIGPVMAPTFQQGSKIIHKATGTRPAA